MDDCNLDKLSVKPGKLSPAFNKNTTDYNVTVGSGVEKITFDCLTSDTGASYCISGSDGGRTVPLTEGQIRDIKIEVTAEDGTTKNYFVHVHRLSAKDAALSDLKLSQGTLKPEFSPSLLEYSVLLPCDVSSVGLKPSVPDSKVAVSINDDKPGTDVKLNVSQTLINIKVTSVDGSNTQVYKLYVYRKQIPRYIKLIDSSLTLKYECPVSLAPLYQPITIKESEPKHSYSGPIIDHFTKTSKIDPLSELPLCSEWRIEDIDLDQEMSNVEAFIPLTGGGSSDKVKLSELGAKLTSCNKMPEFEDLKMKFGTDAPLKHKLEVRSWEKQLQQVFDESDPTKLCTAAESSLKQYYSSLPKPGTTPVYMDGESPIDYLEHAIHCYATAIKNKPKDAALHLKLALVLEERYYVEDLYGVKRSEDSNKVDCNATAKESSKAEECAAICQLHGVDAGAPLGLQLKAIDQEYHHLKESGQSAKADHVQALFAWKSKQATQEGAAAQKASDEESPLGQAYLKCMDALYLDESKAIYHFHVGRLMTTRGDFDQAVTQLETALGWNEKYQLARFYLGFALTLKKNGPETRAKEAVAYLMETMETLLEQQTKEALSKDVNTSREMLHAEDLLRSSNVQLLRGFIELGKLLEKHNDIKNIMSPTDVYHTAALMASQLLPVIHKGDTYQQLEWILLDAHSLLLSHLLKTQSDNVELIAARCQRLSALIRHSTIPQNNDILALQQKTCQILVQIQPCSSHALYLLGNAQLSQYDNDPEAEGANQLLDDAKLSFKAAISLEGKPATGAPPEQLTEQRWWIAKQKEEEEKKKAEEAAKAPPPTSKGGPAAGRGAAAARGGATGRGAARGAAATKGAPSKAPAPAARGGGRGAGAPARGAATSRGGKAGTPPKTVQDKAKATASSTKEYTPTKSEPKQPTSATRRPPSAANQPAATTTTEATQADKNAIKSAPASINKKSHHPRMGLARALTRTPDLVNEALKYYKEVIDLAPEIHDAYIESAEMIVKTDPMAAVDIYSKFPVSDTLSFDDAYIFGEIVRLLMKAEKFDDPRLGPNMIKLGKILGLASLEKYVEILENKYKSELLKTVYAGVNGKDIDDPDMQAFFKFKLWA